MGDALAEIRFAQEALHGHGVLGEAMAQYLDRRRAALGMLGAVNQCGASLAHLPEEAISVDGAPLQAVGGHGRRS